MKTRLILGVLISVFITTLLSQPVWAITPSEVAKLGASDGAAGDYFGNSVSIDGDTMAIGAYHDNDQGTNSGSVYIFTRSGGIWTQQAKLVASDGAADDYFGISVSIDADTVVVGAYGDSGDSGSAYIFTRSGTEWMQQAKLLSPDNSLGDYFGYSVSIDSDTVIIGAFRDDYPGVESGSAYIFTRSGTTWTQQAKLFASDGTAGDYFGISVSIDGDTVVIGADRGDGQVAYSGSAYIFTRSGTAWTQQSNLFATDGAAYDSFGHSVSIDGDTVVIAAYSANAQEENSGSAYIFTRSGTAWTQQTELFASDGAAGDSFGVSVSIDGDTVVIGAVNDDTQGTRSGSAYIFTRSGTTWTQQAKLFASDGTADDILGNSVSIDTNTVVAGAPGDDDQGSNSGSVYIFSLNADPDGDGIIDPSDNCPDDANADQTDTDEDGIGDACDLDDDNDAIDDEFDNCPLIANQGQEDLDGDGLGDVCDPDDDNDGIYDVIDTCPDTQEGSYVDNTGCHVDLGAVYDNGYDAGYAEGLLQCNSPDDEILICHKNKTKTIPYSKLTVHINHGDYEGACY